MKILKVGGFSKSGTVLAYVSLLSLVFNVFRILTIEVVGLLKAIGTLKSTDGGSVQLKMKGGVFDRRVEIKEETTRKTVASIYRQFLNAREVMFDKQTYTVKIQPGVDMAIIVAMCMCLDEMRNNKKR